MREINATDDADQTQMVRGTLLARLGDVEQGRAVLTEVLENGRRTGSGSTVFIALYGLAELARNTGDIEGAWAYLPTPEVAKDELWRGPPQILAIRDVCAGHLHLAVGDIEAARKRLADAFQQARVAIAAGCYTAVRGDAVLAARVLGVAAGLRGAPDLGDQDRRLLDARLRAELGDAAFDDASAAGRAMPREECLALLARILEPSPEPPGA